MAEKGRRYNDDNEFIDTLAPKSSEQGLLIKQDELVSKLNSNEMVTLDSDASAGGSATESLTVSGLLSSDEIVAFHQKTKGGLGTAPIAWSNQADDSLDVEWTGDPGAGAVIRLLVRRSVSESNGISKLNLS